MAAALPAQAASTFDLSTATGSGTATEYSWAAPVLTVNNGANITITGTVTNGTRIEVAANATADITLNNVNISGTLSAATFNTTLTGALALPPTATVMLHIEGVNTLDATASPVNSAGIYLLAASALPTALCSSLTIDGSGTLTATGGANGAGIGGRGNNCTIIIEGNPTINAIGGTGGAGIGGVNNFNAGNLAIHSGTVTATGGVGGGAGIGGGESGTGCNGGSILIDGGTVVATGGASTSTSASGAGIGGGAGCYADSITISGNAAVNATGANGTTVTDPASAYYGLAMGGGAGIGSGSNRDATLPTIPANSITISCTATVTATGGNGALADPAGPTPGKYSGSGAGIGGGGANSASTVEPDPADWAWLLAVPATCPTNPPNATGGSPGGVSIGAGGIGDSPASVRPNPNGREIVDIVEDPTTRGRNSGKPTTGKVVDHTTPDGKLPNSVTTLTGNDLAEMFSDGSTVTIRDCATGAPVTGNKAALNVGSNTVCVAVEDGGVTKYYDLAIPRSAAPSGLTVTSPETNPLTPGTTSDLTLNIPLPSPYDGSGDVTVTLPPGATFDAGTTLPAGCTITVDRRSFTCPIDKLPKSGGKASLPFKVVADNTLTEKDITVTISGLNGGNNGTYVLNPIKAPLASSGVAVPTLNEWALMLLGLAMLGMAGLHVRRRG